MQSWHIESGILMVSVLDREILFSELSSYSITRTKVKLMLPDETWFHRGAQKAAFIYAKK